MKGVKGERVNLLRLSTVSKLKMHNLCLLAMHAIFITLSCAGDSAVYGLNSEGSTGGLKYIAESISSTMAISLEDILRSAARWNGLSSTDRIGFLSCWLPRCGKTASD